MAFRPVCCAWLPLVNLDQMSDYLPRELINEILLKLPVRSLLRFTTVCKSWHSLITSSRFISSHLSNSASKDDETLFFRRYAKEDKAEHYILLKDAEDQILGLHSSLEIDFPFKSQFGYFRIVGSSNGLVCLSDDFFANPLQPIILWNPCIRKHIVLPTPKIKPETAHFFVLGFGSTDCDFKVVRIVYTKADDFSSNVPAEVELYSLNSGSWRKLHIDVWHIIVEFMWSQAFLKGAVHWLAFDPLHEQNPNYHYHSLILAFDMDDEVFGEIMLPDDLARVVLTNLSIAVVWDSLGVINFDNRMGSEACCVWVMKEYGVIKSWTKLYCIVGGVERVIGFRKNGEILLSSQGNELVTYNPETMLSKNTGINGSARSFYIHNYMESFVLLRGQSVVADRQLLPASNNTLQS